MPIQSQTCCGEQPNQQLSDTGSKVLRPAQPNFVLKTSLEAAGMVYDMPLQMLYYLDAESCLCRM